MNKCISFGEISTFNALPPIHSQVKGAWLISAM